MKDTNYCEIHNQGRYADQDYTYCIKKIYIKDLNRFELAPLKKSKSDHADFIIKEQKPLYTDSLFLFSSDYGIIMILPYEMIPKEILKKLMGMNLLVRLMSYLFERRKLCLKK